MFCQNCGNQLADDAKFCSRCGCNTGVSQVPVQQDSYQQFTASEPVKTKKVFNWKILVILILAAVLVIGAVVVVVNFEDWFGSSGSSVSKNREDKDDEEDEDDQDDEEDEDDVTVPAVREDVTYYELPGLFFYMSKDYEAVGQDDMDGYDFYGDGVEIELEMDDVDGEFSNAEELMDRAQENLESEGIEFTRSVRNGVPYITYEEDGYTVVASCYVNGDWYYGFYAALENADDVEEVLEYLTSGETRSSYTYTVGELHLELSLEYVLDGWSDDYMSFEGEDATVEISCGPMEDVVDELGMIPTNSVEFAQAFAELESEYYEVESGSVRGRNGESGYVIVSAEDAVIGFYIHDDTGYLVAVYGDLDEDRNAMIDIATSGYFD